MHTQAHMVVGRGVVRAAHRAGRPLVATNHLMPENLAAYSPIPRLLQPAYHSLAWKDLGRVFRRADVVTAPTPRAVELLVGRAGLPDAFPVSCGIDAERYLTEVEPGPVPTVLFVGPAGPGEAGRRADPGVRRAAGRAAGPAGDRRRRGAARRLDRAGRASWGWPTASVPRVRLRGRSCWTAYARAEVFCMPGIAELQSLATLEAMAAGTPVVAADAMALPHLVRPGRNGWLYRPGDVAELSTRLAALLIDPALRRRMGAASRELVAEHAFDATLDRFEGIYQRVLGRDDLRTSRAA